MSKRECRTCAYLITITKLDAGPCRTCGEHLNYKKRLNPPRDTYDLAEMIVNKVQAGTWTAQAVADAIQKYVESMK